MKHFDIFIIGAGAAGIAAAKAAWNAGCRSIAIADRRKTMGGILLQCAHRGFGHDKNGPEYAKELLKDFPEDITFFVNTTVLSVSPDKVYPDKTAVLSSPTFGLLKISFQQLILASGCREIPLGALPITGTRPSGVFTAGQMQELMNIHGITPDGPAVILGSGDIGLIMASHFAKAGIEIAGVIEQKSSCQGMLRNQNRLNGYAVPFFFHNTIREICGYPKLTGVLLEDGTYLPCRTLLIAAGLRPEQELIRTLGNPDWLHLCGNARQIYPMVDAVTADGASAGQAAFRKL